MKFIHGAFALILTTGCWATVFRVPENFPTIQAALDGIQLGDTIIPATTTYTEALLAPPFEFWLVGDVLPGDTGEYERPVIDPTGISGSDSLACLVLPVDCKAHIEDMKFVNGAAMYPRFQDRRGGIVYYTADTIWVHRCVFDSVYGGIFYRSGSANAFVEIAQCTFRNVYGTAYGWNGLRAVDCLIEGHNVGGMTGRVWTEVERCRFSGEIDLGWVGIYRDGGIVRDCIFGPGTTDGGQPLSIYSWGNVLFENNIVHDVSLYGSIIAITVRDSDAFVELRANLFENNAHTASNAQVTGIQCDGTVNQPTDTRIMIAGNRFANNSMSPDGATVEKVIGVISPRAAIEISSNYFYTNEPPSGPVLGVSDTTGSENITTLNAFWNNEFGIRSENGSVDARFNYWGDPSGPRAIDNPNGQGDEIQGDVLFDPWYPDTSFLDTPIRTSPSVSRHALQVFPNPFNQTATLKFEIPDAGIFRIELFDVLGRRVKELFVGPVLYEKTIHVNGDDLASGIYYARAWQTTHNRPVATVKLALVK